MLVFKLQEKFYDLTSTHREDDGLTLWHLPPSTLSNEDDILANLAKLTNFTHLNASSTSFAHFGKLWQVLENATTTSETKLR